MKKVIISSLLILLTGCSYKINKQLIPINEDVFKQEFYTGKRVIKSQKLYNKNGQEIDSFLYQRIIACKDILIVVTDDGETGILTSTGKMLHKPNYIFENFVAKSEYTRGIKYFGFKNLKTNKFEPFVYTSNEVCEGDYFILTDSTFRPTILFDTKGNKLEYEYFGDLHALPASDIVAITNKSNSKIGFIKRTGELLIEPKYQMFFKALDDEYWRIALDNKWGLMDGNGNLISKIEYDKIEYISKGVYNGFIDSVKVNIIQ